MNITLSAIIVTKDRFEDVKNCIKSILIQKELPDSIIIVDSSNSEGLKIIIKNLIGNSSFDLKYIRSKPGITHQRNQGIKENKNDLVLFIDDDVVLEEDYISEIKKVFLLDNINQICGVTGKILNNKKKLPAISNIIRFFTFLDYNGKGEVRRSGANNRIIKLGDSVNAEVDWLSGCNMCYRSNILKIEICDEKFEVGGGEDVDLSYRIGKHGKLIYCPTSRLVHNESKTSRPKFKVHKYRKMLYHFYKFKKNIPQTFLNILAFYISLIGYIIQAAFLTRNIEALKGTLKGIFTIIIKIRDYKDIRKYII